MAEESNRGEIARLIEAQNLLHELGFSGVKASGALDEATSKACKLLGVDLRSPTAREDLLIKSRQARLLARGDMRLSNSNIGKLAFAVLTEQEAREVNDAQNVALQIVPDNERYVNNAGNNVRVTIRMKGTDASSGCRRYDVEIAKGGFAVSLRDVRACPRDGKWSPHQD